MNIEMLMSGAATYTPLPDVAAAPHAEAPAGTAGATEMIATWGVKFAEWVVGLL